MALYMHNKEFNDYWSKYIYKNLKGENYADF